MSKAQDVKAFRMSSGIKLPRFRSEIFPQMKQFRKAIGPLMKNLLGNDQFNNPVPTSSLVGKIHFQRRVWIPGKVFTSKHQLASGNSTGCYNYRLGNTSEFEILPVSHGTLPREEEIQCCLLFHFGVLDDAVWEAR